jgi:hypothetical protein
MSGNEARFSSLDMYVGVSAPADVEVMVNVPLTARDAGGSATSGEKIRMGLFVDTTNDDNYKAVGVGSGTTFDDDDQGAVGDDIATTDGIHTFVVRETKPTVTLSSLSPSGSAVVGRSEVLRFNVAASDNEDVVLSRMTFKINATDISGDGTDDWANCDNAADAGEMAPQDFDIYNLTDDQTTTTLDLDSDSDQNDSLTEMAAGTDSPWTLLKTTGAICDATEADVGFVHLRLPTTETIPQGLTKTFALYLDTTGAGASVDDSIRLDIPSDPITGTFLYVDNASNSADLAITSSTLAVDDGTAFAVGDILSYDADDSATGGTSGSPDTDEEYMLVTAIDTNDLTVVRGYLGSTMEAADADADSDEYEVTDGIFRMPGSFLWKDDGVTGHTGSVDDFWGSYLVDNTTVSGGTLVF